ncbi:MAG: PEP-CTERM sorting domain-containing protein [Gammaproteobacteria bacterium]|nr:PEP-CTERM sorting domain-containing protein [Gammaproteobacteria bacterium]
MKALTQVAAVAALAFSASAANATVFINDETPSSGLQSFSYTFASDASVDITIGVSNADDTVGLGTQFHTSWGGIGAGLPDITLGDSGCPVDTSSYTNAYGEAGTCGDVASITAGVLAGDSLSFDWDYTSNDGGAFHDFSFIQINDDTGAELYYEVLAQQCAAGDASCPGTVSEPGVLVLFGLGLALLGLRRRLA